MIVYDKLIYPIHSRLRENPKFLLGSFLLSLGVGFFAVIFNNLLLSEFSVSLVMNSLVQTLQLIILETSSPNVLPENSSEITKNIYPAFLATFYISQLALPFLAFYGVVDGLSKIQRPNNIKRIFREFVKKEKLKNRFIFIGHEKFSLELLSKLTEKQESDGDLSILIFAKDPASFPFYNKKSNFHILPIDCLDYFFSLLSSEKEIALLRQTIYIDGGGDLWNYKVLRQVDRVIRIDGLRNTKLLVHINSQDYEQEIYKFSSKVICFSLNLISARLLLGEHPPAKYRNKDDLPVHILLAGFGSLGYAVLQQIILTCHYFDHAPVNITIVDKSADEIQKDVEQRWPILASSSSKDPGYCSVYPIAKISYFSAAPENLTIGQLTSIVQKNCRDRSQKNLPVDVAYVLDDDNILNLAIARRFQQIQSYIRITELPMIQRIVICNDSKEDFSGLDDFTCFDPTRKIMEHYAEGTTSYPGEDLDEIGKKIHSGYQSYSNSPVPTEVAWRPFERASSNASADHLWIKLWAFQAVSNLTPSVPSEPLGYFKKLPEDFISLLAARSEDFLEKQAHTEHRRFCAERTMSGWICAPSDKDPNLKNHRINATLVNYSLLDSTNKAKLRDSFDHALKALNEWNKK